MRKLIKKILLESDWDWVDEIDVVPPHPLSEEDLPYLVGWSFLWDEHAHLGRWAHNDKLFKITRVLGDTIYWLYGEGDKENSGTTSSFIKQVNDGSWVLVSPEGFLYDPLYRRDWKGGVYYSKEDLNESHDWDWVDEIQPYVSFEDAKRGDRYGVMVLNPLMMEKIADDCSLELIDENKKYEVIVRHKQYLSSRDIYCADELFFEGTKLSLELSFWDVEIGEWVEHYWVTDDLIQLYPII